jgi:hypothetical protein
MSSLADMLMPEKAPDDLAKSSVRSGINIPVLRELAVAMTFNLESVGGLHEKRWPPKSTNSPMVLI